MKLTKERKALFIAELARHGIVARAARAASPHARSPRGAHSTFVDERNRDEAFAAEWDAALEQARAEVEHEIYRRAQEGWEEPVYGGRYKETIVGSVRRYSDRLLELRARALLPAYREPPGAGVAASGRVTHDLDVGILGNAVAALAMQFAKREPAPLLIEAKAAPRG